MQDTLKDRLENLSGQKAALPARARRRALWAAAFGPLLVMGVIQAYALVLFSEPDGLLHYSRQNLRLLLGTTIAAAGVLSLLIRSGLRTNRALEAERRALRQTIAILESIRDGFVALDRGWHFTYVNAEGERVLGKTRDALVGRVIWDVVPLLAGSNVERRCRLAMEQHTFVIFEEESLLANRIYEVHVYPSEDGISVYFRDVTEERQSQDKLQASEERYRELFENANDVLYTTDLKGNITSVNNACVTLTGYTHGELLRMNLADLIAPGDLPRARQMLRQKIKQVGGATTYESAVVARDGRQVPIEVSSRLIFEKDVPVGVQGIARDISERKRAEAVLRNMSLTDPLTGLYNRRGAITLVDQQLKIAERLGRSLLLVYADLNHLKQINDTHGHTAGDSALLEVAEVLQETFRESDIIARIGGDEFVVLAMESSGADENSIRRRLLDTLTARNALGVRPFDLSLSIGVARFDPDRARAFEELLGEADRLMYEDKRIRGQRA
ncbi:MAG: sensor domain-containing diguanylate cyclase [Longimicrobiales bacterium]